MRSQRAVWGGEEDNSDGLLHRNAGEDGEGTISSEGRMINQQNQSVLGQKDLHTRIGV